MLETHVFDEKGMQHDISETIILQGGEQGWLLEHKHRHNLRRYKEERKKEIIIKNNENNMNIYNKQWNIIHPFYNLIWHRSSASETKWEHLARSEEYLKGLMKH